MNVVSPSQNILHLPLSGRKRIKCLRDVKRREGDAFRRSAARRRATINLLTIGPKEIHGLPYRLDPGG